MKKWLSLSHARAVTIEVIQLLFKLGDRISHLGQTLAKDNGQRQCEVITIILSPEALDDIDGRDLNYINTTF